MSSEWFAANPSKRWAEKFFLLYGPVWSIALLVIVVPLELYKSWDEWGYLLCGVFTVTPLFAVPLFFPGKADQGKALSEQYWFKANVWIAIFGFVANYFFTHYFFQVLGAAYTMPSHRLNNIPLVMFLLTQAYFCLYHALSNIVIRRTLKFFARWGSTASKVAAGAAIFLLSYATAFMETFTISQYPYYQHVDKDRMYTVGSLFYAMYFWVSFPAFFVMDENVRAKKWPLWRAAVDALAAAMLVLILLDFWRIFAGPISGIQASDGMPFMNGAS